MKYLLLILLLSGCASKVVMANCEKVGGGDFYLCEKP